MTCSERRLTLRGAAISAPAPGALADVLLVDGNPLTDINVLEGQGEHLSVIMKGGDLYKNRLN